MEDKLLSAEPIAQIGISLADKRIHVLEQAARSVRWSILYNVIPRLVTPFSTMILAALLTPADFGLVAVSTFVLALARIVVELGLGKAVIQRQENVLEAASLSFWINLSIALSLYGVLWLTAPGIASLYKNPAIAGVVRLSAAALPLMALQTVPKAMMQRNMEFQSLFWVNASYLIVQALASVILALLGLKAWAIIWGQIIGFISSVSLAWGLGHWRPATKVDWSLFKPLLRFSAWVMASGFQNWLYLYADNAIAGLFLGVYSLGVYSLGFNIATVVPTFLVAALDDVAYPAFCKLQDDLHEVGLRLIQLQRLAAAILFPLGLGLSAVSSPVIHLLYGDKWDGLGMVISILAIMPGLSPIWTLNQGAYQAVGKPSLWTKLAGFSLLLLIPSLWLAAPRGLLIFVIVRCIAALLLPLGNALIGARTLGVGIRVQLKVLAVPLMLSAAMCLIIILLIGIFEPFDGIMGWLKVITIASAGGLAYLALVRMLASELWDQFFAALRRIVAC